MTTSGGDLLEQLNNHLSSACLSWLLGAGISYDANIPLMFPLTERVITLMAKSPHQPLLADIKGELEANAHIEHLLSHLGDYAALADRAKSKAVAIGGSNVSLANIEAAHNEVLTHISHTIRWGYRPA